MTIEALLEALRFMVMVALLAIIVWSGRTMAEADQLLTRPTLDERVKARQSLPVDEVVSAARAAGVDLDTPFDRFGRKR